MTQVTSAPPTARRPGPVLGLSFGQRFWRYARSILVAYAVLSPLVLYRFDMFAPFVMINKVFDFTSIWQQNPVGLSLVELAVFDVQLAYSLAVGGGNPLMWIVVLGILLGLIWSSFNIYRMVWLSFKALNRGGVIAQGFKKAGYIGIPIAMIMIIIGTFTGGFSGWTIVETILWIIPAWFGALVTAGLYWNIDNQRDAGIRGVNVTMGDPDHPDHHHDSLPLQGQDDIHR